MSFMRQMTVKFPNRSVRKFRTQVLVGVTTWLFCLSQHLVGLINVILIYRMAMIIILAGCMLLKEFASSD